MKTVSAQLKISKLGSTVTLTGVTPAEALLLTAEHQGNAGGEPLTLSEEVVDVNRADYEEVERLKQKYHIKKVEALFPGADPRLPEDFTSAVRQGLKSKMPSTNLVDYAG